MASPDEQYGDGYAEAAADDYADRCEARQLEDAYERYEGDKSWSEFVAAEQAADREAAADDYPEHVPFTEPDADGHWF